MNIDYKRNLNSPPFFQGGVLDEVEGGGIYFPKLPPHHPKNTTLIQLLGVVLHTNLN